MKRLTITILCVLGLGAWVAAASEAKCPVSGKPADGSCTVNVNGKEVALCCAKCQKKFEQTLNTHDAGPDKCCISGKAADKATRMLFTKVTAVHLCCKKCAKKYAEKNHLSAIKDEGAGVCPISGKPADSDIAVVDQGAKHYFCCEKCAKKYATAHHVLMTDKKNDKCPISGEEVEDGPVVYQVKTEATYFCCEKCRAKFVKNEIAAKL